MSRDEDWETHTASAYDEFGRKKIPSLDEQELVMKDPKSIYYWNEEDDEIRLIIEDLDDDAEAYSRSVLLDEWFYPDD